jgi:hypothetical protein
LSAEELAWGEALEHLQCPSEILGVDEAGKVASPLRVIIVVDAFDGPVLDRPSRPTSQPRDRRSAPSQLGLPAGESIVRKSVRGYQAINDAQGIAKASDSFRKMDPIFGPML